jgi:hypothetical protein
LHQAIQRLILMALEGALEADLWSVVEELVPEVQRKPDAQSQAGIPKVQPAPISQVPAASKS